MSSLAFASLLSTHALAQTEMLDADTPTLDEVLSASTSLEPEHQSRLALVASITEQDAEPQLNGNRLTYRYGTGQPSIVCAPLNICTLSLAPGERIVANGLLLGDTTRWRVVQIRVGSDDTLHIALKPVDAGLRTSMSILTDQRHYHLSLLSHASDYMPSVGFRYDPDPQAELEAMIAATQNQAQPTETLSLPGESTHVAIEDLNFGYDVSACQRCAWRPERVFDDGRKVYIVLPERASTQALPALLIVGSQSDEQIANYRFRDSTYIVDQLFDAAQLVLGVGRSQRSVKITRREDR